MLTRAPDLLQVSAIGKTAAGIGWLCCLSAVLLLASCSTYRPTRPGEKVYRDVVFATPGGNKLRMDLYVPQTAKPAPVVLWMFGGCWRFGSKGYHVIMRDLTSAGIAVASIQYRMSNRAVYPAQLEDCRAATQWLRDNGARYGIDAKRMGASGESSGGQLAALLAATEGKSRIQGVCTLYPVTDLIELGSLYEKHSVGRSLIEKLLGGSIEKKIDLAADASPVYHISRALPPFLIIHGQRDRIIPVEHSEWFFRTLEETGVEAQLIVVPDKGHWFRLNNEQFAEVSRFFQVHLAKVDTGH
ncbi:MAG: alpha/beta hydrolase [Prosthecobacter sp.]|uniref:alpha/beta hydrolase fold domain-containing protein n=1 Tax=Prosthecobacter sp. TaxID=1965333 RepID=UPI003BB01B29